MLDEFVGANRARVIALEDAYIMARYYAGEYDREDAVRLAREAIKLLDTLLGEGIDGLIGAQGP